MNAFHFFATAALVAAVTGAEGASLCETGRNQSPIDIRNTRVESLPGLNFDYSEVPLLLANDGHTVRVRLKNAGHLQIGATRYALDQFHFHTPGGDRIAGEEFPLAAHILHKSGSGQLLAVVVPFRTGAHNALLEKLLPHIPGKADGNHTVDGKRVSAAELLPSGKTYFRYTGSLTAAPCTEGVEWIVLKQPAELSAAQLALYKKRFADNIRGPQPLNQRVVLESN